MYDVDFSRFYNELLGKRIFAMFKYLLPITRNLLQHFFFLRLRITLRFTHFRPSQRQLQDKVSQVTKKVCSNRERLLFAQKQVNPRIAQELCLIQQ